MKQFLKMTIVGGVLFLLPVVLLLLILKQAIGWAKIVIEPIAKSLTLDRLGAFAGIGAATVLAIILLVAASFAAGLIARTQVGTRISKWFEEAFLGNLPQYRMAKSMVDGFVRVDDGSGYKPVLVGDDDGWQLGYLVELIADGWVAVFLPQAPTPMSGNIVYLPVDRIRPLGISMTEAGIIIRRLGIGSAAALRGTNLELPKR